jgi:hypothetical protein
MNTPIVNKVAESGLLTLDLEAFLPAAEMVSFDLKEYLFMGLILKEKDFRATLLTINWEDFQNKNVAVYCSADAIIPIWAYMLVATNLQPFAQEVFLGNEDALLQHLIVTAIEQASFAEYQEKRVVVKGCGEVKIPDAAYVAVSKKLRGVAKSIMYGEPCSTVPIFKKK